MSIIDIFSKRQKQLRGEVPDVYTYDTIPEPLRVQIIHIWAEAIGDENRYNLRDSPTFKAYRSIVEILCKEYGLFVLTGSEDIYRERNYLSELVTFLLKEWQVEKVLDAIELSFQVIKANRNSNAILELNARFREHGVGYVFDDEIIRVDSQFLHAETVKPALALLRTTPEYAGAQAEFLTAHDHYRHGRPKESLTECLKSLESVMKVVCTKRRWPFDPNATAQVLIKVLFDNGLVPAYWNAHFTALRSTLEAGVPPVRNKVGGHGQGVQVIQVPDHLVAYALHLTASAILFIAASESAFPLDLAKVR